jgi:hypothetical protein
MYRRPLIVLAALLTACASTQHTAADKREQQTVLERARKIIAHRHWPLPPDYHVRIDTGHFIGEGTASYDEWWVIFDQPQQGRSPARLYEVSFRRDTGEFTGAYDARKKVREEEIAVARREFERRFPGEQYTIFAGAVGSTVEVRFMFHKGHRSMLCVIDRATLKVRRFEDHHGNY